MNRKLLATAIGASLLAGGMAYAQANPAPQQAQGQGQSGSAPQTLQTITVTGTHIREAQLATAQPVVAITHQQIEQQGFNSVAEILQNLTVAGSPAISRSSVLASGEDVGGYYIDIHNLGAARTLVLINGQRLGTTDSGLADLQQIPLAAIERIEVLKDGASAIYGSDAIGGVVNIITRSNFTGAEADAYVGQYDQGDGKQQTYSMTIGAKGDKGSVMLAAEYNKEDPVWAANRWFSQSGGTKYHPNAGWSAASQYGLFFNYNINTYAPYSLCGSAPYCTLNQGGNPYDLADYHASVFAPRPAGGDESNPNSEMMLQTGLERKSLFVSGRYDITDHIHFQTDILYNNRNTTQQVAGYPFQPAFNLPGSSDIIGLSPDSYYNPLGNGPMGNGDGDTLWFYRRGWEVPRVTQSQLSTYRIGGQLSGDFNIGEHNWNWDVGAFSNINDSVKTNHGDFSLIATANALGPSYFNTATNRVECGTAANPLPFGSAPGSCVPWNPLIPQGQTGDGALTGNTELQQYLFPIYHDVGRTQTTSYSADITGALFSLPAGDLAIAAGVNYRQDKGYFIPDAFEQAALSTNLASGPTRGGYTVKSEYVEVNVPILKDVPAFKELSLDVAARHSKYSSFGSTTNGKFTLTWRPIQDLLVGGTFSHGFRAPQISDLFGGISGTFDYYTDPCDVTQGAGSNPAVMGRCTSGFGGQTPVPANFRQLGQANVVCSTYPCQTGVQFFSGANPLLQPEKAINRSAQVVYSPSWLPQQYGKVDLSLDYFNIVINNVISGDSVSAILNDCYVLGIASRCSSSLFTRGANGVVNFASYGERNAGQLQSKGWDLGLHYAAPTTPIGLFQLTWNTTYYSDQNSKATSTSPIIGSNGWGSNFRYRSVARLDWAKGPFSASWTTRLYSSMKVGCSYNNTSAGGPECNMPNYIKDGSISNVNRMGDTVFHDISFRYMAPWNASISVGVNNVFNHWAQPDYEADNSQYPYYGGFDIGRYYFLRYNQKF